MKDKSKRIPIIYIGDGLFMRDNGWNVAIAVNHHENEVAFIDKNDINVAIDYLTQAKNKK